MTVCICLDKNGGRLFNRRRQSRDRRLIDDLCVFAGEAPIFASAYSAPLFSHSDRLPSVTEDPSAVPSGGIYFCEREDPLPLLSRADTLVIYRWNKVYPADCFFTHEPGELGFRPVQKTDFPGNSHNNIDREVYRK